MTFRRNISWTFWGNVTYAVSQWAMLMVLAKFSNAEIVGKFALGLSVTAPIFAFANLQLREIQATDIKNTHQLREYVGFRGVSSIFAMIIIVILSMCYGDKPETMFVIVMVGLAKFFESFSDVMYGMLQKHEHMKDIAVSLICKGVFTFFSFAVVAYFTKSIVLAVVAMAVAWAFLLVFIDMRNVRQLIHKKKLCESLLPFINKITIIKIFKLSWPMGLVIMLGSLNLNIPRYLIENQMGVEALGYYSAIMYLVVAGNTVVGAVGQSATPRLARYFNDNLDAYQKLMIKITAMAGMVGIIGVIIACLFGEFILTLLYTPAYASYSDVLVLTMVLAIILYCSSMLGRGITAARCFMIQAVIAPVTTIIILLVAFFTISSFGLLGAVICLIIGFFCKMILELFILKKVYNKQKLKTDKFINLALTDKM